MKKRVKQLIKSIEFEQKTAENLSFKSSKKNQEREKIIRKLKKAKKKAENILSTLG